MGSFLVRDVVFDIGIVMDGFVLVEVEVVEVTERVSWSALTVAESGSPYSSFRWRQSHSFEWWFGEATRIDRATSVPIDCWVTRLRT
jgi:hypothetical protein